MFYVERLESYHGLRFSSRVSRVRPIHLTSSGKAVAAFNPEVAEAAISAGFVPRTARSISSTGAVPPLPGRNAQAGLRLLDRGGRARPRVGGRPGTRSHRRGPGCHLGGRAGDPDLRISHRPGVPPGQGGGQPAHERGSRVVDRLRLPLTWFARAERGSPPRNLHLPFPGSFPDDGPTAVAGQLPYPPQLGLQRPGRCKLNPGGGTWSKAVGRSAARSTSRRRPALRAGSRCTRGICCLARNCGSGTSRSSGFSTRCTTRSRCTRST